VTHIPRRTHAHFWKRPLAAVLGALMLAGAAGAASAQRQAPDNLAVQQFTQATRDYAWLHRRLENTLEPMEVTADPAAIHRAIQELAAAIRAARPDAAQGDLFTPALAPELRARMARALASHGYTPADVRAAERADGVDPAMVALRVNGAFPWVYGTAMFPCVLQALPALPPELQYRIVGDTLVLVDVHASLIVDLLPGVLAELTER
jgi:hypothetical protein